MSGSISFWGDDMSVDMVVVNDIHHDSCTNRDLTVPFRWYWEGC